MRPSVKASHLFSVLPTFLARRVIATLVLLFMLGSACIGRCAAPDDVLVLRGATIHTLSDQGTFVGDVVVRDGKIVEVGEQVTMPTGAREIDLTGCTLVPGLIDSRSTLWLTSTAIRESSTRGSLDIVDGVDPWQEDWREVARQGVTAVYIQPSSQSSLGGTGAVLRVAPGEDLDDLLLKSQSAVQAAVGISGNSSRDRYTQFQRLRTSIKNVKEGKELEQVQEQQTPEPEAAATRGRRGQPPQRGGRGRGGRGGARGNAAAPPDRTEELLRKVVDGEIPLRLEVHHADAIRWAVAMAKEFDIRVLLEGVSEAEAALSELSESQMPMVLGPSLELGSPPDYRKMRGDDWLSQIAASNSPWALATFGSQPRASRLLRVQAAAALSCGADRDEVLASVTINAARLLGLGDQLGSIEPGKQADMAIFAGDPLDPAIPARMVISRGSIVHEAEITPVTASVLADPALPDVFPQNFALRSERVLQDGQFSPATVLIQEGRIAAIGPDVQVREGVLVVDLEQAPLTSGLVAAHTYLDQQAALDDNTESDASHIRATDAVDPFSKAAQSMLSGGFINVAVAPSSSNTAAGMVGLIRLGADDFVVSPAIAGKFVVAGSARSAERFPSSLGGQVQLLNEVLFGEAPSTQLYVAAAVERSLMSEKRRNVERVSSGELPAIVAAETGPEIDAALEVFRTGRLNGALLGPSRPADALDQLQSLGLGIIARPVSANDLDVYVDQLAAAVRGGVPIAFAGDSPAEIRVTAALAVNAGVPSEVALRGLTSAAAGMTGMPSGTATLQVGAPADLVIWSASPINLGARPLRVFVGGSAVDR